MVQGLDQYQLRDFEAITRHVALVAVVYSLLPRAQYDRDLLKRLQCHVEARLDDSPASKRRMTQAQALFRPGGLHQCVARAGNTAEAGHGSVAARGCLLSRWLLLVRTVDALARTRRVMRQERCSLFLNGEPRKQAKNAQFAWFYVTAKVEY